MIYTSCVKMNGPIKSQFCTFHNSSFRWLSGKLCYLQHNCVWDTIVYHWASDLCVYFKEWSPSWYCTKPSSWAYFLSKAEQGLTNQRRHYTFDVLNCLPTFAEMLLNNGYNMDPVFIIMYPVFIFAVNLGFRTFSPRETSWTAENAAP